MPFHHGSENNECYKSPEHEYERENRFQNDYPNTFKLHPCALRVKKLDLTELLYRQPKWKGLNAIWT